MSSNQAACSGHLWAVLATERLQIFVPVLAKRACSKVRGTAYMSIGVATDSRAELSGLRVRVRECLCARHTSSTTATVTRRRRNEQRLQEINAGCSQPRDQLSDQLNSCNIAGHKDRTDTVQCPHCSYLKTGLINVVAQKSRNATAVFIISDVFLLNSIFLLLNRIACTQCIKMRPIAIDVARSVVCVSVCVYLSHGWAVQKRLKRLRCRLVGWLLYVQKAMY